MAFDISGKVALISGGASGLGLEFAEELLKNGLKGVTLADINNRFGQKAVQKIEKKFGPNKAIYVQTDVTNNQSYEEAFKKTIEVFQNLDIVINNAGIFNDAIWEKEIAININGVIHGILLGLENYIPKNRTGPEGVIINISSVAGLLPSRAWPIYTATKHAVLGMSQAFGDKAHFDRTKVRVLALCPGATETHILDDMSNKTLGKSYSDVIGKYSPQTPKCVALALVEIVKNAKTGTVWVVEDEKNPYQFVFPERQNPTLQ